MLSNKDILNGIIVSCSSSFETSIVADPPNAKRKLIYCTVKKVTSLHHFLTLGIPVTFSHDKFDQQYFKLHHIYSNRNTADISTKARSGPILA